MSSKLLPEILFLIFSNLENDSDSLLSCCLVSRDWCLLAISWLWKQPFHICPKQNKRLLIKFCLELSNDESKKIYKIKTTTFIFDYVSFLRHLNYSEIYDAVSHFGYGHNFDCEEFSEEEKRLFMNQDVGKVKYHSDDEYEGYEYEGYEYGDYEYGDYEYEGYEYGDYEYEGYEYGDYEYGDYKIDKHDDTVWGYDPRGHLDHLYNHWTYDPRFRYYNDEFKKITQIIFHLFLSHSNKIISLDLCTGEIEEKEEKPIYEWIDLSKFKYDSLVNIKKFVCDGLHNLQAIIDTMKDICHDIEILEIIFEGYYYYSLSNLIKNQKNLKELKIIHADNNELNEIIDSLSYQAQTLKFLQFEYCIFENRTPFREISLLHNLKELNFIDCNIKNTQDRSLDFAFLSLKKIQVDMKHLFLEEIERIITHSNLEEISLMELDLCSSNIFNIIAMNCPNIKFLDLIVGDHDFNNIILIFTHCQQLESINLQLGVYDRNITKNMKDLATNIPEGLNNLVIMVNHGFSNHDLMAFFSQFNGILKVFGFISKKNDDDIDDIIREYAERKCVSYHINIGSDEFHYRYVEFDS